MATATGFGVASVSLEPDGTDEVERVALTDSLGCTEFAVEAYRLPAGKTLDLPPGEERVVVPLSPEGSSALWGTLPVPARGIGRAPPGHPWTIEAEVAVAVLVLRTPGGDGADELHSLSLDAARYVVPETSDVATAHLTAELGCGGLKANARVLDPGQAVPTHTEGTQEELFVPLDDGGTMRVAGETIAAPRGTVVRVAPATPRSARNPSQAAIDWFMFGAPPTGGPTDWDPGATILEEPAEPPSTNTQP